MKIAFSMSDDIIHTMLICAAKQDHEVMYGYKPTEEFGEIVTKRVHELTEEDISDLIQGYVSDRYVFQELLETYIVGFAKFEEYTRHGIKFLYGPFTGLPVKEGDSEYEDALKYYNER